MEISECLHRFDPDGNGQVDELAFAGHDRLGAVEKGEQPLGVGTPAKPFDPGRPCEPRHVSRIER